MGINSRIAELSVIGEFNFFAFAVFFGITGGDPLGRKPFMP